MHSILFTKPPPPDLLTADSAQQSMGAILFVDARGQIGESIAEESECCKVGYSATLARVHVHRCLCSENKGLLSLGHLQGVVTVRKCKGSFCSSSYGWCSELLHVETASCYEPLQQRTKTAQMCSGIGQIWERRTEAFVSRSVELLWS